MTSSVPHLTAMAMNREAEIRLTHRDRRIIKTAAITAGKAAKFLNIVNYLLHS